MTVNDKSIHLLILLVSTVSVSWAQADDEVPVAATPRPSAEAIDSALLADAIAGGVRSGVASLLARLTAPANESSLVLPPQQHYRRTRTGTIERRYRKETFTRPIYENHYAEQLVPQRNDYGEVVGYRSDRVVVARKQIGVEEATRLVRDDKGDIVRTDPTYERGDLVENYSGGIYGLNAMALYVLAKAGLAENPHTNDLAESLKTLIESHGLPDQTWDLAWIVAGYSNLNDSSYDTLIKRTLAKLLAGQIQHRGPGEKLWGPISIDYEALRTLMNAEMTLRGQLDPMERQLEQMAANDSKIRALEARMRPMQQQLHQILAARLWITQHAHRLGAATDNYRLTESARLPGLNYPIHHWLAADVDSTAIVLFALDEAKAKGKLPATVDPPTLLGRPLGRPLPTQPAVDSALRALGALQKPYGGWDEHNSLQPNPTFARTEQGVLIPLVHPQPELVTYETMDSNFAGLSGMVNGLRVVPTLLRRHERQLQQADDRIVQVINRLLDQPLTRVNWPFAHQDGTNETKSMLERGGRIVLRPTQQENPQRPVDELVYGAAAPPYAAFERLVGLLRPIQEGQPRHDNLQRQLAYRLLATQQPDGQWSSRVALGIGPSSAEMALLLNGAAESTVRQSNLNRSVPDTFEHWRATQQQLTRTRNYFLGQRTGRTDLYCTLVALAILVERLDRPIDLQGVQILPEEPILEIAEAVDAPAEAPEPLSSVDAARNVPRPNDALQPLLRAVADHQPAE